MHLKKISILVALLLITAGAVYYFTDNLTSETKQRQGPYVDSLAPDNRPSFTARRDTVPQPAGEKLSPGTALLRATVLNSDEATKLKVRVEEVLGYGSSTPPISGGTEFVFNISNYLEQNPKIKDLIDEQNEIKLLVSHQQRMKLDDSDKKQDWSFVGIESE